MLEQLPQVLVVTHWGQAEGRPIPLRITGWRRTGAADNLATRFERLATVPSLPAGSGRFGYTVSVPNLPGGDWEVRTERTGGWRTGQRPQRSVVRTRPAQLAYGPAVKVWSWPAMVLAGAALALVAQALLLARSDANVAAGVMVSVGSCLVGFAGAKAWYLVSAGKPIRRFLTGGVCIQGFLLAALTTLAIGGALTGIGAGELLDATTPGLFLGMAVGRPGCFFTGCCAGRPTASRWGLWSSDRTIAARRIPVQLWEAAAALVIGLTSLAVLLLGGLPIAGSVFVAAIATYTGVRQLLFPLRADPHTRRGRHITLAVCVVLLVADLALVAAAG
ncbi:prolipoprotein diacylglyceryl transferase family protein [Mycolicibacterium rhodesiae]|uniref:prolipoprotein diacylglyceryl transferase family protein n=1 Tax=Mycolicibacterium rhodesiae TaxID=36814 RepID=UPI001300DF60|nr:prolipoprotein diacylglyceryl transferase family protein [Mycolicibacterium rhodesiae]